MNKKIFGGVLVVAIAVGAMINVNLNNTNSKSINFRLSQVEALASENDEIKPYKKVSTDCPPPKEYKKSVSCPSGTTDATCSSSDC
jgi:hypothetical protein